VTIKNNGFWNVWWVGYNAQLGKGEEEEMKKILIVDDQETVRRLVELTLKSDARQVLQAKSGEEGLEIAKAEKPDLVIMDIMMPGGMDGFEAVRILKATQETKNCPILMLTAKNEKSEKTKTYEAGADDYLAKPFKLDDLMKKVEKLVP
jgi:CheY-like chemotaxis protein